MQLNLTELLNSEGKTLEVDVPITETAYHSPNGLYPIEKAEPAHLVIHHEKNRKLTVTETIDLTLSIPCDRCLTPVSVPLSLEFSRDLDLNATPDKHVEDIEDLDEQPYVIGTDLDVDLLTEDELVSNLPMKVLCSEDCKGLCRVCGANLNTQTCNCDTSVLSEDPRMSKIRDIFNNFKEV